MKIEMKDLEFDKDFLKERAKEMGLYQLILELPENLSCVGYDFKIHGKQRVFIRENQNVKEDTKIKRR